MWSVWAVSRISSTGEIMLSLRNCLGNRISLPILASLSCGCSTGTWTTPAFFVVLQKKRNRPQKHKGGLKRRCQALFALILFERRALDRHAAIVALTGAFRWKLVVSSLFRPISVKFGASCRFRCVCVFLRPHRVFFTRRGVSRCVYSVFGIFSRFLCFCCLCAAKSRFFVASSLGLAL